MLQSTPQDKTGNKQQTFKNRQKWNDNKCGNTVNTKRLKIMNKENKRWEQGHLKANEK